MEQVRVILIGAGGIARSRHIPQLRKVSEAAIVALVDPAQGSSGRRDRRVARHRGRAYLHRLPASAGGRAG